MLEDVRAAPARNAAVAAILVVAFAVMLALGAYGMSHAEPALDEYAGISVLLMAGFVVYFWPRVVRRFARPRVTGVWRHRVIVTSSGTEPGLQAHPGWRIEGVRWLAGFIALGVLSAGTGSALSNHNWWRFAGGAVFLAWGWGFVSSTVVPRIRLGAGVVITASGIGVEGKFRPWPATRWIFDGNRYEPEVGQIVSFYLAHPELRHLLSSPDHAIPSREFG